MFTSVGKHITRVCTPRGVSIGRVCGVSFVMSVNIRLIEGKRKNENIKSDVHAVRTFLRLEYLFVFFFTARSPRVFVLSVCFKCGNVCYIAQF